MLLRGAADVLAWPGIVGRARVPFVARIRDIRPYAADGLVCDIRMPLVEDYRLRKAKTF